MSHDPLCPVVHSTIECGYCALIARVRADERERVWSETFLPEVHVARIRREALTDLRARVEGLRDESARELGSNLSRNEISERVGEDTAYAAVLALIDEAAK